MFAKFIKFKSILPVVDVERVVLSVVVLSIDELGMIIDDEELDNDDDEEGGNDDEEDGSNVEPPPITTSKLKRIAKNAM